MTTSTVATDTRRELLEAARTVVRRDGVAHLTLDAVAHEAGRSKGGVLYHFPTKEALVRAVIDDDVARFDEEVERVAAADPGAEPGRWLRAFVEVTANADDADYCLSAGILAAVANDPALLQPLQATYDRWQARAEADGADPVVATLVRLAADGIWLADMFSFAPPQGTRRTEVIAALRSLVR